MGAFFLFILLAIGIGCPYGAAYFNKERLRLEEEQNAYQIRYALLLEHRERKGYKLLQAIHDRGKKDSPIDRFQSYVSRWGLSLVKVKEIDRKHIHFIVRSTFPMLLDFFSHFQEELEGSKVEWIQMKLEGEHILWEGKYIEF